jgi:PLP dependent protein
VTSRGRAGTLSHPTRTGPDVLATTLQRNLESVRRTIAASARRAGRDPADVELVAVTKTVPSSVAAELVKAGQRDLGENRADVLEAKVRWFADHGPWVAGPRWHFVGHIQRNKARAVVEHADVIHSVDSLRLLETLDRIADDVGRSVDVYLQVKLYPEENKSGLDPTELASALATARRSRRLNPVGLMTMAPLIEGDEPRAVAAAHDVFTRLASWARERAVPASAGVPRGDRTSMGMSEDYEIAIESGSTCVRVGSALFADVTTAELAGGDA